MVEARSRRCLASSATAQKIAAEVAEMRALIETEKPPRDAWDLKLMPGGLVDIEFIAQVAVLTGRDSLAEARLPARGAGASGAGFRRSAIADELARAHTLFSALTQTIRLCLTGPFDRRRSAGLADLLLGVTDLPDMRVLEAHVEETARKVRKASTFCFVGKPDAGDGTPLGFPYIGGTM